VHGHYRTREEVEEQKTKDPIRHFFERLSARGLIDQQGLQEMDARVRQVVEDAIQFADASPEPSPEALYEDVYSVPYGPFKQR
jgi:pyruvate dehydrogenase E1 component alpha subunit